ncbi:MAG: galactokinase [Lachnospiraceae bacterium]|nr:galactokinase [Lachnospiraceae bacterium]
MKNILKNEFSKIYDRPAEGLRFFFAPGRVNLIGEHTDYNGGHVFPCALTIGTYAAVLERDDKIVRFYSMNLPGSGVIEIDLDKELKPTPELRWAAYPAGVIWAFAQKGMKLDHGFDILFNGNIPNSSGLSSSASIEVVTGFVLKTLYGFDVSGVDLALIGQFSENKFNGMNCGIMDQFAVSMGKKDHAIFLDCATLSYEYASVKMPDAKIVITNSKVKHHLVDSAYNDRRNESETALKDLQAVVDIKTLGDLTNEEFDKHADAVKDPICRKRAKHAVYENQRTIEAVKALAANDIKRFGELMNQSHISLRDDYEVSCPEIDVLVESAWKQPGVVGSRITGGGFGGCTVSIVKNEYVDAFIENVGKEYVEKTGKTAEFYVVEIGDGPYEL